METIELTVRLPKKNLDFAERYAREHQMTVDELIARYLQRLQTGPKITIHPDVQAITGLIPAEVDGEAVYKEHLLQKHGRRSSSDNE